MIRPSTALERAADLLAERGHVSARNMKTKNPWKSGELTLHSAVRIACDMDPGDSTFAYWRWRDVTTMLEVIWRALDENAIAVAGHNVPAIVWANSDTVSTGDVVSLLRTARPVSDDGIDCVVRRPPKNPKFSTGGNSSPAKSSLLLGDGTLQTSIAVSIVVLKEIRDVAYGDLLSELSKLNLGNEELLSAIDGWIFARVGDFREVHEPDSLVVARLIVKAISAESELLERESDRQTSLSVCEFLSLTEENANWSGLSDSVVLDRLLKLSSMADGRGTSPIPEVLQKEIDRLRDMWV